MDVYVQPSRQEGFGLTVAEAKILGKLIIASDLPSIKEQITSGEDGFLVAPTPECFCESIKKVMAGGEMVRKVREAAKKTEILQTDVGLLDNI